LITSLWRRPTPAAQQPDEFDVAFRERMRQIASCLALCAITFLTGPTKIISDTKIDMALDPAAFLSRALHMWDPAQFGQIQNQAYGYLFPMGPFYALFESIGMPSWIVQRMWLSLVLCVAFLGAVRLARALNIGTPATRLVAGFAFALAPHAQILVGVNSSEFWPTAVLPWIVLPLVKGAREGYSPRRAAALSALATFACGGINAAAEAAVLVVPALYLLTRRRGPRRRRLMTWWVVFTAFVTVWWAVPLLLMAGYVFPFLPYTESATATTGVTSLTNILRGVQDWVGFVPVDGRPWWPAGYEHATATWLIVATAVVAGLGITGLVLRRLNERTFLLITLLVGVAIMASGHVSDVSSPLAPAIRDLFDGPLAAIRNLHKFDVLVRLPVCLGVAHLLTKRFHVPRLPRLRPAFAVGLTVVLALTMLPVATAGLAARGSFTAVPGYWKQASSWLNAHTGDQTVLAVPGARWGEYTWGRPLDEPMQAELNVRWASRQIVPWGSDGMARLLEGIDDRLTSGRGSIGLSDVLRRMGVKYLLVRNDLDRDTLRGAWPPRVHEALDSSPGLKRVTYFGGLVGSPGTGDATTWYDQPYPALEIYQVANAQPVSETVSAAKPLRVTGGPESLLTLADEGLLQGDRPVVFDDDPGAASVPRSQTVVTDSLRRREVKFSDMRQAASPTLTKNEPFKGSGPARDTTEPDWAPYTSTAKYDGLSAITASSSASDITAPPDGRSPGLFPYSAFDGDSRTAWESAGWDGPVGEWLDARFATAIPVSAINVSFVQNLAVGPPVSEVEISTKNGTVRQKVGQTAAPQTLKVRPGGTDWLKIRVTKVAWQPKSKVGSRVGISEITVPGLFAARTIVTPKVADPGTGTGDATVALSGDPQATPGCMLGSHAWACSGSLQGYGEDGNAFDRTFPQDHADSRTVHGSAVLTNQGLVNQLTTLPKVYPQATASSTMLEQPQLLGRSAVDGDPRTMWIPSGWDPSPSLTIKLGHKVRIDRLQIQTGAGGSGGPPVQVSMIANGQVRGGWAGADGWIAFPPVTADHITLRFTPMSSAQLQIADVVIPGVKPLGQPPPFQLKSVCGLGPALTVDGHRVPTKITGGTMADLLAGQAVSYESCKHVAVRAGDNRIKEAPTSPYQIMSAVVGPRRTTLLSDADTQAQPVPVGSWGPSEREVHVSTDGTSYLTVNENFNKGWQATMNGRRLQAVRLDGWKQAWVIPGKAYAPVTISYGPDLTYRAALLLGLLLVLVVAGAAIAPVGGRAVLALPSLPPGRVGRVAVWIGTGVLGFWTAGIYGLVMILVSLLLIGRARRLLERGGLAPAVRHFSRGLASPWFPAAFMTAAGLCMSVGTQLQLDERFAASGPLRDVAAQMLCLPILGALAAALSRFAVPRHGEPLPEDAPMVARPPAAVPEARPPVREPVPVGAGAAASGAAAPPEAVEAPGSADGEPAEESGAPGRGGVFRRRWRGRPAPEPDPVAAEGEPGAPETAGGGEPDAAAVLGLTEEDLAILAETEDEVPVRAPRFTRKRRAKAAEAVSGEPVGGERDGARVGQAVESEKRARRGWFEQPERTEDGVGPDDGHTNGDHAVDAAPPVVGEDDRLVASLNHGGWGPPPDTENTGPLGPPITEGPPPQPDDREDA
jgi:arabinofuranan 3-O-arabinosyltransferase